ncbi:MAG TPA: hypothetical protein DCG49_03545 [Ruminococcus sp.]|nr:hypothetical protein [Ruminococcus sp.]
MRTKKQAAAFAAMILAAQWILPMNSSAASVEDAAHLLSALTGSGEMNAADDFNGDGAVNAVDLTLLKRDLLAAPPDGESTEKTIPVSADTVKLIGRTMESNGATLLVQSGAAVECTVTGESASVTLTGGSEVKGSESSRPRYAVFVDDVQIADVLMSETEQEVELFSGKKSVTKKVKIIHLTEANQGAIGVKAFKVKTAAAKPVKPTPKKDLSIEFIGDSITCAYGVEAESQYEGFTTGTENFMKSYAYLTAQLLDADYSAVSYSGYGIVSGYSNNGAVNTASLVPDCYEYVGKSGQYAVPWDFEAHPMDVIVLNLGTNDDSYASKEIEVRGKEYQEKYVAFLKQIREKNPESAIVCTLGIMGAEELYPYLEAAVAESNDPHITCYQSPTQKMTDGLGADWHPSPKTQELNAYLCADKICEAIGRESSKIGIDLAADGSYGLDLDKESGANAWPYFSDWDKSLNVNISAAGTSPESMTAYVRDLNLPAGGYELSFRMTPPAGVAVPYAVRNRTHPETVYCTGTLNTEGKEETVLLPFTLEQADPDCEIVILLGEIASGNVTIRDVTLYKRS